MELRKKLLGFGSALALTVAMSGGIVQAAPTTTTATFNENPNGACSAAVDGSSANFGTYQWSLVNGGHYEAVGAAPTVGITVTQTYGPPNTVGCDVTISATDMTGAGGTISKDHLYWHNGTGTGAVPGVYIAYGLQLIDNGSGAYSWAVHLNNLWGGAPAPGTYTGTLTLTAVHAAP